MNRTFEDYDEAIAEDYDESFDDESYDEPAEDLLGTIGNVLTGGLPMIASGIGNLIGGAFRPQPSRPPLPQVNIPNPGPGVNNATLNTPAGSATIALPAALVRQDEFRVIADRLEEGINRNTGRLNTVTGDVTRLRGDFVRIETDTRTQVAKLRTDTRKLLIRSRREQVSSIAKMRKDQSSQQTTNLMMTLMMQQQVQSQFNDHKHVETTGIETEKPTGTTSSNNMMFMLMPMLMTGDTGSSDNMMLPMMMMMMANQNK